MHYNNEDFYLNGALICKVRPETQTMSNNYSTSKKKYWEMYASHFPQVILLKLYWLCFLQDYSCSHSKPIQAFLVNKTNKMCNTHNNEANPLITEDWCKVLLFVICLLHIWFRIINQFRELNQQSVIKTLPKKWLRLTENNSLPSLFWWKRLGGNL